MGSLGLPELFIILLVVVGGSLWVWMIVDCATNEPVGSDKIVWILIVLFGAFHFTENLLSHTRIRRNVFRRLC